MTGKSTLDPDNLAAVPPTRKPLEEERALGPSDSSDSGSDLTATDQGAAGEDRFGTGERAAAGRRGSKRAADVDTDRIVGADEAGLGGGLDQAEEARAGKAGRPGARE